MNNFFDVLKQAQDLKGKVSELKYKLENTNFVGKDDELYAQIENLFMNLFCVKFYVYNAL